MPELRIMVDPANPGQFFACCGLFELLELYEAGGLAWFEADRRLPRRAEFVLNTPVEDPLNRLLAELRACEITGIDYEEPTIAPVRFRWGDREVVLNWWLKDDYSAKDPLKPWGGQQTGAGILKALIGVLPPQVQPEGIFALREYTTTRLGVDPRSTWSKLDCGYSPNERDVKEARTAPLVDVLAAFGLQGFHPGRDRKAGRAVYTYALWNVPLPRVAARAAAAGAAWQNMSRTYQFRLLDRGQGYKAFDFAEERKEESR